MPLLNNQLLWYMIHFFKSWTIFNIFLGPGIVGKPLAVADETLSSTSAVLHWKPPIYPNGAITMYRINLIVLSTDPLVYMRIGSSAGDRRKRQTPQNTINVNCVIGGQQNLSRNFTTTTTSYTVSDLSKFVLAIFLRMRIS